MASPTRRFRLGSALRWCIRSNNELRRECASAGRHSFRVCSPVSGEVASVPARSAAVYWPVVPRRKVRESLMMYRTYRGFGRALLAFSMVGLAVVPGAAADINVVLDRAKLEKLPDRVATIVVGNPLIADANVQSGNMMVVTGKGYGETNVLALDRAGTVLMD